MSKHLILARDQSGDWYKQAQDFLSYNNKPELVMTVSDKDPKQNAFLNAVNQIRTSTGDSFEIGPGVMLVLASDDPIELAEGGGSLQQRCQCQCGGSYSTCGGGGGGH